VTDVYTRVSSYIGWIFEFIKDRHQVADRVYQSGRDFRAIGSPT